MFGNGNWQLINPDDPEALQQPLSGLYLLIGGQATVTAILIPAGGSSGAAGQPSAFGLQFGLPHGSRDSLV